MINNEKQYELIKFEDGEFSLDVNVSPSEDTVWLTQKQMSLSFNVDKSRVSRHIKNIFDNKELPISVVAENATTGSDGKIYYVKYYNLDMIISIGYRVNSKRGILFRKWATQVLKQYLLKGSAINEKRCLTCEDNLLALQSKVHDRFIIIDDDLYTIGSSLKDCSKKLTTINKLETIDINDIINNL